MAKDRPATVTLSVDDPSVYRTVRLVITPPSGPEASVVLSARHVRIGASESNDVVLDDPHASRFHCEIRRTAQGYLLRDLGSTNGTVVGGMQVKEGILRSGATLSVGATRIRFLADEGSPEEVQASSREAFGGLVGRSVRMRQVFGILERIAPTELTVLVHGETGAGKDVLARAIHEASPRARGPFVVFDCAAVSPTLIESELFGHVRGAFTGAHESREGAFERAHGGTLFLDEVGELSPELQPKLLRALEQRQIRAIGGDREREVDVRIVAATHRNLEDEVQAGRWRRDLFFRLSVVTVTLPALRDRLEDLPLLAGRLLEGVRRLAISPEALNVLARYDWPGNVRELRNVVESAAALCQGPTIEPRDLIFWRPQRRDTSPEGLRIRGQTLETIERAAIAETLAECGGNKTRTAKVLGISPSTLYEKLKKYGL